ncbi:MAG: prolipoprotein diacylglyceryl transferase [Gemmatimonadaceae bacterium]|nr:prolipoprotein diacylglyceryl transferase [Gemmatimonadaceae bacterium]
MARHFTPRHQPVCSQPVCSPCAVHVGSVARLSPACPRRGSAGRPRDGSSLPRGDSIPDERARRAAPAGAPGGAGQHSAPSGRGEGRGVRGRSAPCARSVTRHGVASQAILTQRPCAGLLLTALSCCALASAARAQAPPGVVKPAQLYEAFAKFLIFLLVINVRRFRKTSGEVFFCFLVVYAVVRSALETLRGDPGHLWLLTTAQFLSIQMGTIALIWWVVRRRAAKSGVSP